MKSSQGIRIFAIILFGVILFTGPVIKAPFSFEDEHEYVKIANPGLGMYSSIRGSDTYFEFTDYLNKYQNQGRFKPASLAVVWMFAKLSSGQPLMMRLLQIFLIALTLFLLFKILNDWGLNSNFALLSVLLFVIGPYDEIFYRIGPSEIYALTFCFAGIFFYNKYKQENRSVLLIFSFLFFILMGLSKESFIPLLFLSGLFSFLYLSEHKSEKIFSGSLIFSAMIMAGIIINIDIQIGAYRGGLLSMDSGILLDNYLKLIKYSAFYFILVFFCLPVNFITRNNVFRNALLFFLLFLFTQAFVYRYIQIESPVRYFLPALLPIQLAAFYSLGFLETKHIKKYIYVSVILVFGLISLKNVFINSSYFSARAGAFQSMIKEVSESKADAVLFLSDPATGFEFIDASTTFLSANGFDPMIFFNVEKGVISANNFGLEQDYQQVTVEEFKQRFSNYIIIQMAPEEYAVRNIEDDVLTHARSSFREEYFNSSISDLTGMILRKDAITYTIHYPANSALLPDLNLNTGK